MRSKNEVLIYFSLFFSLSLANPNQFYVSPSGSGTTCSLQYPCSLSQAISLAQTATSVVNLLPGSYYVSTTSITIHTNYNITILGESRETTLLVSTGTNYAFSHTTGNNSTKISFSNITFTNFTNGIMFMSTPVSYDHCDFINNNSPLLNSVNTLSVTFCRFTNNIIPNGNLYFALIHFKLGEVSNCIFANTSIYTNGYPGAFGNAAVVIEEGTLSDCTFDSNYGGAICMLGGTVKNCAFTSNYADAGGAITASGGIITNCSFTSNYATTDGGAIAIYRLGQMSSAYNYRIESCTFISNYASYGGAIYSIFTSVITNSTFIANHASGSGGAIFFLPSTQQSYVANCSVSVCTFTSNYASNGGALYLAFSTVAATNFQSNYAANGGGGYFLDSSVSDCTFQNNTGTGLQATNESHVGGGAIYCKGQNCNLQNVVLSNNSLTNTGGCYGGGIFLAATSVTMTNSRVQMNSISECDYSFGGGVFISRGSVSCYFYNVTVEENQIVCSEDSHAFKSLGAGIFLQNSEEDLISPISISNNTISCKENQTNSAIYTSSNIYVAPTGSNDISCGLPYFPCDIYSAVAFSQNNITLVLAGGTYTLTRPLAITTNITILAENQNPTYFSYNSSSVNATIFAENDISLHHVIFTGSGVSLDFPLLANSLEKRIFLNNCTFQSIASSSPSIITDGYIVMENSTAIDNNYFCLSQTDCFGFMFARGGANISDCTFSNNFIHGDPSSNSTICQGAVVKVISGDLLIENSIFHSNGMFNCSTMGGSALSAEEFNQIMITSSVFQNNSILVEATAGCGDLKGGGIHLSSAGANSSVYLSDIDLQYNSITTSSSSCETVEIFGGGMHCELDGENSHFSITSLNGSNNQIFASDSTGTRVNGGALSISGRCPDIQILSSHFSNNSIVAGSSIGEDFQIQGVNSKGGALHAESSLMINNSVFDNNLAFGGNVTGGAIFSDGFISINSSIISNNQVISNSSVQNSGLGGGIFVTQIANFNNVTFSLNSCVTNSSSNLVQAGGAIYLYQSNSTTSFNECYFISNSASSGGAICVENLFDLPSMNEVSAINNTAAISGGALFILQWFVDDSKTCEELFSGILENNVARDRENDCDSLPNFLLSPSNQSSVYASPGTAFEFEVALFNYFNQISYYEDYIVYITSSTNDLNTGEQKAHIRANEEGIYKFTSLAIIAPIHKTIFLNFTTYSLDSQNLPTIKLSIAATSVNCQPNQVETTNDNQSQAKCISCERNQFSFTGECEPCPDEAEMCVSSSVEDHEYSEFEILEGFWPNSFENPTGLIKCPFEEACEPIQCEFSWNVEGWNWDILCKNCSDNSCSICSEGYSNYLCSECVCNNEECWYATEEECEHCDNSVFTNLFEGAGVLLFVIGALLILPSKGMAKLVFELFLVIIMELLGFLEWVEVGLALLILLAVLISKEEIPSGTAQAFLFYIQIISTTIPDEIWAENMQKFMEHLESLNFRIYGLPCIYSGLGSPIAEYIVFYFLPFAVGAIILIVNLSKQFFDSFFLNKLYRTICGKFARSDAQPAYQPLKHFADDSEEPQHNHDEEENEDHSDNNSSHPHSPSKLHLIDTVINTTFVVLSLTYYSVCTLTFQIFVCENGYLVSYPYYPCDYSTNYLYLVIIGSLLGFTFIIGYPLIVVVVLVLNRRKIKAKDHSIEHRFEFLVENYRPEVFYFEIVWLVIKLFLAIAVSLETRLPVQQFLIILILSSSLLTFVFTKPYTSSVGNSAIILTLVSLSFTFGTTAVFYYIEDASWFSLLISLFAGFFICGYLVFVILGAAVAKWIKKKIGHRNSSKVN